jgi:lipoprotein-releasing system ATP-binding protein
VQSLFFDLNRRHGTTFLIVTHSRDFAAMMPRQVSMKDGRIVSDERRPQPLENQGKPT